MVSIPFDSPNRVIARGLSKWYSVSVRKRVSLQEVFHEKWNKLCRREQAKEFLDDELAVSAGPKPGTLWALRDLSFEIAKGEVLGVVGSNGAGKSTLVRLLSRLTGPSAGEALIEGKIASVLEVGSGFHPELTVRENALLNGVFLGMRKFEVNDRMDAILDFSELKRCIDTPVKKISHGMQYRLAVSVALHSDSDFTLMDEVLEVADFQFEEKCFEKISQAQSQGRSFLFVSHNLSQVRSICNRILWLDQGRMKQLGKPADVLEAYRN
ncbi:MAG: ABC transporter ATP-binding protein [Proteobacteria bacterium]|nr:ABC transporter ATP-binding protein [Pseudomonadota bacterium]